MTNAPVRRTELMPLAAIREDPANPKDHDLSLMGDSVGRFGFIEPLVLDERTGYLISGHGRRETLARMEAAGQAPPDGVSLSEDGAWLAPVSRGWSSHSDAEAHAALIALNRIGEVGGWRDALLPLLGEINATDVGLTGTGYTAADLAVLAELTAAVTPDELPPELTYSRNVDPIIYRPTQETPPPVADLVDRTRTAELKAAIEAAVVPPEVRDFLLAGAERHLVFDYANIAEFYAHAKADVQALMEASALVIVDFDDAMHNGYVQLSSRLAELLDLDQAHRAELNAAGAGARSA